MKKTDPYEDHRDKKGRFKKGNPGGPGGRRLGAGSGGRRSGAGRPRTWMDADVFLRKWGVRVSSPPRCVCGYMSYRFKKEGTAVLARCNQCDEKIVYDAKVNKWWKDDFSYTRLGKNR